MNRLCISVFLCLLLTATGITEVHAQDKVKAAGAEFSLTGIGINLQLNAKDNSFHSISAEMDMAKAFMGMSRMPGIRASYVIDFVFSAASYNNFGVRWFAGPGFTAGYVQDMDADFGIMAGICGNAGVEFTFAVPVILSLSFSPVLAAHTSAKGSSLALEIYRYGLLQTISPRLGIKYDF